MVELGNIGDTQHPSTAPGPVKKEHDTWLSAAQNEYAHLMSAAQKEGQKLKAEGAQLVDTVIHNPGKAATTAVGVGLVLADMKTGGEVHRTGLEFLNKISEEGLTRTLGEVKNAAFGLFSREGLLGGREASSFKSDRDLIRSMAQFVSRSSGDARGANFAAPKYMDDIGAFYDESKPAKSFSLADFQKNEIKSTVNSDAGVKAVDAELKIIQERGKILRQNLSSANRDVADLTEEQRQLRGLSEGTARDVRISGNQRATRIFDNVRTAEGRLSVAEKETGPTREEEITKARQGLEAARKAAQDRLHELEGSDGNSGLISRIKKTATDLEAQQSHDATETQALLKQAGEYVKALTTRLEQHVRDLTGDTPPGEVPRHIGQDDLRGLIRTEPTAAETAKISEAQRALAAKEKPVTSYLTYRERYGVDEPAPVVKVVKEVSGGARGDGQPVIARPTVIEQPAAAFRPATIPEQSGPIGAHRIDIPVKLDPASSEAGFVVMNAEKSLTTAQSSAEAATSAVQRLVAAGKNSRPSDFRMAMRSLGNYVEHANDYLHAETNPEARREFTANAVRKLEELLPAVDKSGKFEYSSRVGNDPAAKLEFITGNLETRLQRLGLKPDVAARTIEAPARAVVAAGEQITDSPEAMRARRAFEAYNSAEQLRYHSGDFKGTLTALSDYARSASDYMQSQIVKGANVEDDPILKKAVADLKAMMPDWNTGPYVMRADAPTTVAGQLGELRKVLDTRISRFVNNVPRKPKG